MPLFINPFHTLQTLEGKTERYHYYSLPELEKQGVGNIRRLPVSIRIMLESLLRNCDGKLVKEEDVVRLAKWSAVKPPDGDVPFVVSRVILQDFTGVPLLVDLAAMRDAVAAQGFDPGIIEPQVPVDLVIDHSVQVDRAGTDDAFLFNLKIEFQRNRERYSFLKWGQQAYKTFKVIPPGIGIVHQVNLEYIASVVTVKQQNGHYLVYPDTLVGTDSHTTMINGLGVVGWGVGGIEAEAAMLGQPVFLQMPEVIGVHLSGNLQEGVTATDLTLRITEMLRKEKVVGKFIEFFGEGAASLTVADRATIGNMAPEYGATMGFFPVDDKTLDYLRMTGREEKHVQLVRDYLEAQQLFGIPRKGEVDFTKVLELDLSEIRPCVSGPKRPQDRIDLIAVKERFQELLAAPISAGGYEKSPTDLLPKVSVHSDGSFILSHPHEWGGTESLLEKDAHPQSWGEVEMVTNRPYNPPVINPGYSEIVPSDLMLRHGSIVIAAITSCTNTSNPSVMIAAGLLAKKAVEKGLGINPLVKTSLAPGSRIVTDYLDNTGLQNYLNALGFQLVAYGCTTCIGNSGPLDETLEKAIKDYDIITASVLSGNRNFEARIHGAVKANFLMSPPLVIAYAIAGRIDIDLDKEPLGVDQAGHPVFLKDIWPSSQEIEEAIQRGLRPEMFKTRYSHILEDNPVWKEIITREGAQYDWEIASTYIQQPPYFEGFTLEPPKQKELKRMRVLALFGDSVTTDHISPAGSFKADSPAGKYLLSLGVKEREFNSYGSRRGNHLVMMRGTFANVRLRNKLAGDKEGGYTRLMPDNKEMAIFDACQIYSERKVPLIVFAGKDYGMGSSRDWAAKGSALLGVRAVVARSFERIHRSNLIGMGVLPLEFKDDQSWESLGITGEEQFSILGLENGLHPNQDLILEIERKQGKEQIAVIARLDTAIEVDYYHQGGILPYVLRQILASTEEKEDK
ncbi:aconitate hydratase [Candidatus Protochlamydia phocaeensis]|uniref:aconitate hydratase n=1 Tax=Candidatus Protochlamydia phocaeensis TaxID=1414722 RepID=UPI000837FE6F|nr:aconitate hydratase [Candidatus Protochlamydia phocaeensis]